MLPFLFIHLYADLQNERRPRGYICKRAKGFVSLILQEAAPEKLLCVVNLLESLWFLFPFAEHETSTCCLYPVMGEEKYFPTSCLESNSVLSRNGSRVPISITPVLWFTQLYPGVLDQK